MVQVLHLLEGYVDSGLLLVFVDGLTHVLLQCLDARLLSLIEQACDLHTYCGNMGMLAFITIIEVKLTGFHPRG